MLAAILAVGKTFLLNRIVVAALSGAGTYVLTTFGEYHEAFCQVVQ